MHTPDAPLHIGRLRLRAPASQWAQARATLAATLARAPWPQDDGIVVLRRLNARGQLSELPARAADEAARVVQRAVPAASPAADTAEAVRFRDALDYRACLLGDLLDGCAQQRWHWRHRQALLSAPLTQAVAELLGEAPLQLPALLDHPSLRSRAPALWIAMDPHSAGSLLDRLGEATGWAHALRQARDGSPAIDWDGSGQDRGQPASPRPDARAAATDMGAGEDRHRLRAPLALRPQDRLPRAFGTGLTSQDPRVLLPALLLLWRQAPARLSAADAATQLRRWAAELLQAAIEPPGTVARPRPAAPRPMKAPPTPAPAPHEGAPGELGPLPPGTARQPASSRSTPQPHAAEPSGRPSTTPPGHPPPQPPRAGDPDPPSIATPDGADLGERVNWPDGPSQDRFSTRFGGCFFLLNALNLPAWQSQRRQWQEPQAGWRQWLRLIWSLDGELDAALETFLVRCCGLETAEGTTAADALATLRPAQAENITAQAAPREGSAAWLREAALRRYGSAALAAALAPRVARVSADASDLRVHLRMADIDLDIRRSGLDINPGWLPWLGRVVQFHYE